MELTITHACLMLVSGNAKLLIDPGIFTNDKIDFSGINAVVITHEHADHVDAKKLRLVLQQNADAIIYTRRQLFISYPNKV